jgi:U4/U6.U5 tri-snRNP-associated protein 1
MSSEKVIELSVEETNKLRESLGLAPLRTAAKTNEASTAPAGISGGGGGEQKQDEAVLEMSVDESNALRAQLGLPPLRGESQTTVKEQHAPAVNEGETKAIADRITTAKLRRDVQQGASQYGQTSLGDGATSARSFAEQMRQNKKKTKKKKGKAEKENAAGAAVSTSYSEEDVKGLKVGHSVGDFQEGSTTVLTLADTEILTADETSKRVTGLNEDDAQLENVNMAENDTVEEGLRQKRKMEMGLGRAGGYAGFDDDEFEELGGAQGPSRAARGALGLDVEKTKKRKVRRGFQIGAMLDEQDQEAESDLFAAETGKAISLQANQEDRTMSDFMTAEEEAELRPKKEKKRSKEFKKKKKKKDKKEHKRRIESEDDDNEEEEVSKPSLLSTKKSLADELEETAPIPVVSRKRRRQDEDEEKEENGEHKPDTSSEDISAKEKRAKFEVVMEKGNERTRAAFSKPKRPVSTEADEEPDDAFLNAALAKARRLNRLKQLSTKDARGADAVAQALEQSSQVKPDVQMSGSGGIKFSIDDTREFTLALRAKKEQEDRDRAKKEAAVGSNGATKPKPEPKTIKDKEEGTQPMTVDEDNNDEEVDMEELAKEVKEEDSSGADLLRGETAAIGKGLGGVLNMLRQTGELSRKNAGREELRGRAKDERTYEDYEALDLSKVVRIDERNANPKDREFASREIKLEYRDEHGRLLTRKEAFREMSYQFHGYGSGKRKSEKKMKQIAREQAEQRVASKQGSADGGMLGALKTTQKATGKAYVVHKT